MTPPLSSAPAGIQRISETTLPALTHRVEQAGLLALEVDFSDCNDKDALLQRLADALALPEWFGHNWDALDEALDDLPAWRPAAGHALFLHGTAALEANPASGFAVLLEILGDAVRSRRADDTPLQVFIIEPPAPDDSPV